jgi:hypothetical protein
MRSIRRNHGFMVRPLWSLGGGVFGATDSGRGEMVNHQEACQ